MLLTWRTMTSSSSPIMWQTTFPTSAWRRQSTGSQPSLPFCSPEMMASLRATSSPLLRSTSS
eukprot:3192172-Pleurochrysis_carterae.AAC.1